MPAEINPDRVVHNDPQLSIDHDHLTGDLVLSFRLTGYQGPTTEIRMSPTRHPHFAHEVSTNSHHAVQDILRALATGPCPTCQNVRLVDVPRGGRSWSVDCPDCRVRYDATGRSINGAVADVMPFPQVPT